MIVPLYITTVTHRYGYLTATRRLLYTYSEGLYGPVTLNPKPNHKAALYNEGPTRRLPYTYNEGLDGPVTLNPKPQTLNPTRRLRYTYNEGLDGPATLNPTP